MIEGLLVALARLGPLALVALPGVPLLGRLIVGLTLAGFVAAQRPVAGGGASPIRELALGALLGLLASTPVRAATAAGHLGERGAGFGGSLGLLYRGLALATFALAGGVEWWGEAVVRSYELFPLVPAGSGIGGALLETVGQLLVTAVRLGAPVLLAQLVAEVGVGWIRGFTDGAGEGADRPSWAPAGRSLSTLLALLVGAAAITAALGAQVGELGGLLRRLLDGVRG